MYIHELEVEVIPASELSREHVAAWRRIQLGNPELGSPYFCPEFTGLVASVLTETFVAILYDEKRLIGFFPFRLESPRRGGPIAGPFTDYQGLIIDIDTDFDATSMLMKCGLQSWTFDHLLASQKAFSPYHKAHAVSPIIDLSKGFDVYFRTCWDRGSEHFRVIERKRRKLIREVGDLRYESHVADSAVLRQLIAWKSQQILRSGFVDPFAFDWPRELMERLHATQSSEFSGRLSVLYSGDEVLAAHLGMCSHSDWHYWLPAYSQQFGKYSPGLLLLMEMAKDAADRGFQVLDFGKGDESYKPHFSNAAVPLAEGRIAVPSLGESVRSGFTRLKSGVLTLLRKTPLGNQARMIGSAIRRYRSTRKFR